MADAVMWWESGQWVVQAGDTRTTRRTLLKAQQAAEGLVGSAAEVLLPREFEQQRQREEAFRAKSSELADARCKTERQLYKVEADLSRLRAVAVLLDLGMPKADIARLFPQYRAQWVDQLIDEVKATPNLWEL